MNREHLLAAAEVIVVPGTATYDPKRRRRGVRLAVEHDSDAIGQLGGILADVDPASGPGAWMEWPSIFLLFVDRHEIVAKVGILGAGEWVRLEIGDFRLRHPELLARWLRDRSVDLAEFGTGTPGP